MSSLPSASPSAELRPRLDPLRAFTGVALFLALGMLLGYARDASLAAVFGASAFTDAFFVAVIIPTMLAAVVMSGALAPALLPVFGTQLQDRAQAWALANTLLSWGGIVLVVGAVGIFAGAPWAVQQLAPGLDATAQSLAVRLTQLGAPLLFLLGMSALMGALANALGSFRLPALANVLVNGSAFLAILAFGANAGIQVAIVGLVVGALVQLFAQAIGLYRQGWRPALSFRLKGPGVRETFQLFVPLAAFVALAQSVPIVERVFGSLFSSGDLSLLAYAGKLYQIPGVVLSGSLAIVLYPHLIQVHTDTARDATPALWNDSLAQGVRSSIFLTLPVALWFVWNAVPLVHFIFQRGAFSAADSQVTAPLVQIYMLAVVPAGILLVLTRALHAQRKMRLTLGLGVLNTAFYLGGAFLGVRLFGLNGLPLAFALSQVFGCAFFSVFAFQRSVPRTLWNRSLVASVAAAAVVGLALALVAPLAASAAGIWLPIVLLISLAVTTCTYLALAAVWGNVEASHYLGMLRRALASIRRMNAQRHIANSTSIK